jgi:isopropylmalate/homocitrate/citramalate synthase
MEKSMMQDPNIFAYRYNDSERTAPKESKILDTTLREGEQAPGVSFTHRQRLQIAWMLDYFGVDYIEISPIVSESHEESCRTMIKAGLSADIVAHLRALPQDIDVALRCDASWIAMYHSVSDIHLQHKLRIPRDRAIERAVQAVEYAKSHGLKLRFTMEDASRADPEFLKEFCRAVSEAGADRISLPDTLGIMAPRGMNNIVRMIHGTVDTPLDMHCHNDLGLALANSLAGLEGGATMVHTTIDGLGERTGLTSLAEVALAFKMLYRTDLDLRTEMLRELSGLISTYTAVKTPASKPLVGDNAYKHKAGTHVAAIIRNPAAYELTPPQTVGNRRRIIIGELAGRTEAAFLMKMFGLAPKSEDAERLMKGLKDLRTGDLFELELSKEMEREIVQTEDRLNREGETLDSKK